MADEDPGAKIGLKDVLASVAHAVLHAKQSVDEECTRLAESYQKNELFAAQGFPVLRFSEVTLELNFAVSQIDGERDLLVVVDANGLGRLPAHACSKISCKILPQNLQVYRTEEGQSLFAGNAS